MNSIGKELIQDLDIRFAVELMLRNKKEQLDILEKTYQFVDDAFLDSLLEAISYENLKYLLEYEEAMEEKRRLKRDVNNIRFLLYPVSPSSKNASWENKYNYAKTQVNIVQVVEHFLGITNFRRNAPCPFHADKSPSFKAYEKTSTFKCFGCGAFGDHLGFVMQYTNCSFKEAVELLYNLHL